MYETLMLHLQVTPTSFHKQSIRKQVHLSMLHTQVVVQQMHKWDEWCSCLRNASANVEAKHLGCYRCRPETPTMIVLNDYRKYPQAHGSIILAFHPKVFRVSFFIFSQRRSRYKSLAWVWRRLHTCISKPIVHDWGKNGISRIVDTHLSQRQG
jgi:hypothetical protein